MNGFLNCFFVFTIFVCISLGCLGGRKKLESTNNLNFSETVNIKSRAYWQHKFDSIYFSKSTKSLQVVYKTMATSNNSSKYYFLAYGIDALNEMYLATKDVKYLNENIELISAVIDSAKSSKEIANSRYRDDYWGWGAIDLKNKIDRDEMPLYESYLFRYVLKTLMILKQENLIKQHEKFYNSVLHFTEKNIWGKWNSRYLKKYSIVNFIEPTTHMTAHWGMIALFLNKLSTNTEILEQTSTCLEAINSKFKDQLKIGNENGLEYYYWNLTWDDKNLLPKVTVQDISHGNNVVSYFIECYKLNTFWTKKDMVLFSNTLKVNWDNEKNEMNAFVNRTTLPENKNKYFIGDGFVKLGYLNINLMLFMQLHEDYFSKDTPIQFYAGMCLNYHEIFSKK